MLYFYRYFNNLGGRYYASLGNRFISNFRHFTCRIYRFNDFWKHRADTLVSALKPSLEDWHL